MRLCVAAALCALLAACAAPVQPSPGLNPPSQPDSAAATDATLMLTASGQVACSIPYGCSALLLIQPNSDGASPSPVWTITTGEPVSFPLIGASAMGTWDVGALPTNAPGTIAPGRYHVAGVINLVSDVASPVTTPVQLRMVATCLAELSVAGGSSAKIAVRFSAAGTCEITTTTLAGTPESSSGSDGIVPPGAMTVSVSNGTTLGVEVVVNDSFVTTLDPGGCLGCRSDDAIPASVLPPLPWQVEVRNVYGRTLVALPIHAGDVIETSSYLKGDGNRVDLSCGRIDIWSGPPMLGPAPEPGTPGDCRP